MDKIKAAKFDTMTYGELALFEEVVGSFPTTEEELDVLPKSKLMMALGWIAMRRDNPETTFADVEALPVGSIIFDDDDEDAEGNEDES